MIRWYLIGGLAVALSLSLGALKLDHDALGKARHERDTAIAQASVNQAGAEINDTRAANIGRARSKAEEGRHAVQEAPDLDHALAEFGVGIDGVRAEGHRPVAQPDERRPDGGR